MKILLIRNFPTYMSVNHNKYNIQEVGLAKALVRKGHICDILFWTGIKEEDIIVPVEKNNKVTIFYRHGITVLKNTVYSKCTKLFENYDILQPCEYNQIQSWILARKYPHKTVIFHGPYYSSFNWKYNLVCRVFDYIFLSRYCKLKTRFIAKSRMAYEFLVNKGILYDNVKTIGVGIDIQMLSCEKESNQEYLYLSMKKDINIIKFLYVGCFEERRDILFIIKTFYKINQRIKNTKLYLVGNGERKYVKKVFDLIDILGLKKFVVWQDTIEQKHLADIYIEADFFMIPTEYEIFGMVLLEAMYYKTVVLTTHNGGSSMLIDNRENGLIFDDKYPEIWAEHIIKLCNRPEKIEKMKRLASEKIRSSFTWDRLVDNFIYEYERLINYKYKIEKM